MPKPFKPISMHNSLLPARALGSAIILDDSRREARGARVPMDRLDRAGLSAGSTQVCQVRRKA